MRCVPSYANSAGKSSGGNWVRGALKRGKTREDNGPPGESLGAQGGPESLPEQERVRTEEKNQMQGRPEELQKHRRSFTSHIGMKLAITNRFQKNTNQFIESGFKQSSKRKTVIAFLSRHNPCQPDISKCLKWRFHKEELFLPPTIEQAVDCSIVSPPKPP